MHYRNGREAKNGDLVATPGKDYCNGSIAPTLGGPVVGACMCDCIHADDLAAILAEKGLDKRPAGK